MSAKIVLLVIAAACLFLVGVIEARSRVRGTGGGGSSSWAAHFVLNDNLVMGSLGSSLCTHRSNIEDILVEGQQVKLQLHVKGPGQVGYEPLKPFLISAFQMSIIRRGDSLTTTPSDYLEWRDGDNNIKYNPTTLMITFKKWDNKYKDLYGLNSDGNMLKLGATCWLFCNCRADFSN